MEVDINSLKITFEKYTKNERWFNKKSKEFERKYRQKFIAVIAPEKFLVSDDLNDLITELEKKKKMEYAFITSIPPKGVASILSIL